MATVILPCKEPLSPGKSMLYTRRASFVSSCCISSNILCGYVTSSSTPGWCTHRMLAQEAAETGKFRSPSERWMIHCSLAVILLCSAMMRVMSSGRLGSSASRLSSAAIDTSSTNSTRIKTASRISARRGRDRQVNSWQRAAWTGS